MSSEREKPMRELTLSDCSEDDLVRFVGDDEPYVVSRINPARGRQGKTYVLHHIYKGCSFGGLIRQRVAAKMRVVKLALIEKHETD